MKRIRESIAIVGIGCRLPGGINSPGDFWEFLKAGGDGVRDVPPDRWDSDALFSPDPAVPGKTYARRGGFLSDIDQFDPAFFGISPREAMQLDPQQRVLLETAHEAMEDAGERWEHAAIRNTGVFVGVFIHDYQHMQFADRDLLEPHSGTGTAMSIIANRVSYCFDLHGPSVAVDTACSSSLVAVDLACKALLNGDCDYALAGGVNLIIKPENTIALSKANMLSKDGRCKSFDASANGYVRSEGAGLVLLRRTSEARAQRRSIYAVVLGSGVNSDGRTKGISVPNGDAQQALTRRVLAEAGVAPASIQYVEAHGTGTPVGDPIEANALGHVLSEGRTGNDVCLIGSVKSNVGHLESASGVVGLIKTALCLKHGALVPNLHFRTPNPAIDFERLRLEVVVENRAWPSSEGPRRAALNSFGFGGTNAHAVLEEAPHEEPRVGAPHESSLPRLILPLGAHDAKALRALAGNYAALLARAPQHLNDLLYTASQRRSHFSCRAAIMAAHPEQLQARLLAFANGELSEGVSSGDCIEGQRERPVFVFSGMGPQWWGMARELLQREPVFRAEVEAVDRVFQPLAGWSIWDQLLADESSSRIQDTHIAQPAIFAVQAGLTALWRHYGVTPAATVGHSVGEVAAMYAAGILSLEDAVTVSYHRSRLQQRTAGSGGMLAVGIDLKRASALLSGSEGPIAIGAINGPRSLTLSGDVEVLEQIRQVLSAEGIFAKPLQVEVPYHGPQMAAIREELLQSLRQIRPQAGHCRCYSTTDRTPQGVVGDAEYWYRNVRQTVRFADAISEALDDGNSCFLEVGPHSVLRASIRALLDARHIQGAVPGSLQRGNSDFDILAISLGQLHVAGISVDWSKISAAGDLLSLPRYPWQHARYWSETSQAEQHRKGLSVNAAIGSRAGRHPLLGSQLDLPQPTWLQTLRLGEHRYFCDHKVQGTVVFPGTGYLEIALQTLIDPERDAQAVSNDHYFLLSDVEIGRALYLADDAEARLQTTRMGERWTISGSTGRDAGWVRHASGRCRREKLLAKPTTIDVDAIKARCVKPLAADYAYRLFRDVGLEYGPSFQAIQQLWYGPQEALARLSLPVVLATPDGKALSDYLFHPALLDACLHTLFGALNLNGEDSDLRGNVFLPVSFRLLKVYRKPTSNLWSHGRIHQRSSRHFEANVRIFDEQGEVVAEVVDLRCQALEHPSNVALKRRQEWMFEYAWDAAPLPDTGPLGSGAWLVLAPHASHPLVNALRSVAPNLIVAVPGASFERRSHDYVIMPSKADFESLLNDAKRQHGSIAAVVHGLCLSGTDTDDPVARQHQEQGACSLMCLVQALTPSVEASDAHASKQADTTRLYVFTEGAEPVTDGAAVKLAHAAVWGLRRVIANEHPQLRTAIIDIDASPQSFTSLVRELQNPNDEDEICYRHGERFIHRLRRYVPAGSASEAMTANGRKQRMQLAVPKPGDLKSMRWIGLPELELADWEVEIEVQATGLNFKDVMKATGLYPARLLTANLWSRELLGMECAGRVVRVGAKVVDHKAGDSVMALAPRAFASHVVTHSAYVTPMAGLEPAEAAGVPAAFVTASMALEELARLQPGERVLIHAASGGVGQAAIQIAQDVGAEIFATVGSEAKRRVVESLGVKHIFDSRSLRFAEEIREATGGEGVDVVLNSLAGDAITAGVSLLRDYGRFIEIGKMDLDRDFPLGLRPFTRCLSFHAVDLDRMLAQRVEVCGRIFRSIYHRLATGRLRPLPVTVFEPAQATQAFLLMAAAGHTGKLVLTIAPERAVVEATRGLAFSRDASYVISGGLGGFGYQLAVWMARRGAGHLVLLGRRGLETPGAGRMMDELQALGASVQVEACDVADAPQVRSALNRVPSDLPVRGVFHAAAVLDDALIKNLDVARYQKTFAPKAAGAWNLHQETLNCPLDHFMCFSSMASILGNQGSGNYCAANAFVDTLAHYRHSLGLPALTVNWGVIADVGMAADEDFYRQNLERQGVQTIHSDHCLEFLELLLQSRRVQTTVCPIDLATFVRFNSGGKDGRLKELLSAASDTVQSRRTQAADELALRDALAPLNEQARIELAQSKVRQALAEIFRTDATKIDPKGSLTDLGADSLMAIEIKNRLEALGLDISVTQLLNRNSVATLASSLLRALGYGSETADQGAGASASTPPAPPSWFVRRAPRDEAKIRLFCFPYAGGTASVYNTWPTHLPEWVDVVAISLPGRGARLDEDNVESIALAADAIAKDIKPLLDRPFALFGHCMGAIIMYEVAQRLQDEHRFSANHIFASGCMAPHLYNSPVVHEQDDKSFLDVLRLISFTGTRALLDDGDLRNKMFPLLRGDFRSVAEYGGDFRSRNPLRAPITGLAADNDLFAAPRAMEAWDSYTSAGYELAQLHGDHYFVESDRKLVTAIVASRLAASLGDPRAADASLDGVVWSKPVGSQLGKPPIAGHRKMSHSRPRNREPTRVFCFPPAGLYANEFIVPESDTPDLVYTRVEWHGERESPVRTLPEMVERAHAAVLSQANQGTTIFYGYCLGGIVAYELALRLQREKHLIPDHLLVAGVVGPHLYVGPNAHQLPTAKLLELLTVLHYPLIDRLQKDRAFSEQRMKLIRADLEAAATYEYQPAEPLAAPIAALSLRHDLWSYPFRTNTWAAHTEVGCRVEEWDGDHYNGMRQPKRVHELIRAL